MADVFGSASPDILTGTATADLIQGLGSDDVLYAFDGNDLLQGGDGDDILYGGSGDDTMDGGSGEDLFYGQSGNDTVTYASALAGLTLNMADNSLSTGDASGDFYLSVENFVLSGFDDIFIGSAALNEAHGGDGNDLLQGFGGNDVLIGDAGNDTLDGGAGADQLVGGQGFDLASYASSAAGIVLDLVTAANSTGDAFGDSFIDVEAAMMTAFADQVLLSETFRKAYGGDGNDQITGNLGRDTLVGGAGDDRLIGEGAGDLLQGDAGADRLEGGAGDDSHFGGADNDILIGGLGADVLDGGDGDDIVHYSAKVTVDFLNPANNIGQAQGDTFASVEGIAFFGAVTSKYVGGSTAITLIAAGSTVVATAGSGAEQFVVSFGSMSVSYATTTQAVTYQVTFDGLVGSRGALGDSLINVSSLTLTAKADVFDLTGFSGPGSVPSTLFAGLGNDRLTLNQNSPATIDAGGGNDTVSGHMAAGTLALGSGNDVVDMAVFGISVQSTPLVVIGGGGADNITITTTQAILNVTGDFGDDTISLSDTLSSGDYSVDGGDGNDTITTLSGNASVLGGAGDDTLIVTAMTTLEALSGGDGNDTIEVNALAGLAQGGQGNDDVTFNLLLSGAGTAIIEGGAGDDTLTIEGLFAFGTTGPGNFAEFRGGDGNDTVQDNTQSEFVAASFVFNAGWGQDTISGFDDGSDIVRFDGTAGALLDDFADLTVSGDATQTVVSFGLDTITINGLDIASFTAADVLFV